MNPLIKNFCCAFVLLLFATFVGAAPQFPTRTPSPISDDVFRHVGIVYCGFGISVGEQGILPEGNTGSGVVVDDNIVLTCAHVIFDEDENTDSATWKFYPANEIWWEQATDQRGQNSEGVEGNPIGQINGFVELSSYSARVKQDLDDELVSNADVAVLWSFRDLDITNSGGANVWADGRGALQSRRLKKLAGYPSGDFPNPEKYGGRWDYSVQWSPEIRRFYATNENDYEFSIRAYADDPEYNWNSMFTPDVISTEGNSGGPLFVADAEGEGWGVAGVLTEEVTNSITLGPVGCYVRAVDGDVVNIINDAKAAAAWDGEKPLVQLVSPANGDLVDVGSINLEADSSSDDVAKVIFSGSSDGIAWSIIGEDDWPYDKPPYPYAQDKWAVDFDTSSIQYDSQYWIKAEAVDYFGNVSAASISVITIDNRDRPPYQISVSPSSLDFAGVAPGQTATLSYGINNTGKNSTTWSATKSVGWITDISPSSVELDPGEFKTIEVTVDTSGLALGAERSTTISNSSPDVAVSNVTVSLSVAAGAGDGSVTLTASGDTYVSDISRSSNYGGMNRAFISDHQWALFQFPFATVPEAAITIKQATLRIYCESLGTGENREDIYIHVPQNEWVEGSFGENSLFDPRDGISYVDIDDDAYVVLDRYDQGKFQIDSEGWHEVDVTEWAEFMLEGSPSRREEAGQGMLLRYHGEPDTFHAFGTREGGRAASVTIEYIEKDGQDPSVSITSHSDGEVVLTSQITLRGTAYDASGVDRVRVEVNGGGMDEASTTDGWATWSKTITLQPGPDGNVIEFDARDKSTEEASDQEIILYYLPPTLDLSVSPLTIDVMQGDVDDVSVLVSGENGFAGLVELSVSGASSDVSTTLGASSVTASGSTSMEISVGRNATPGEYQIDVTGEGGGLSDVASLTLNIVERPEYSITVVSSPMEGGDVDGVGAYAQGDPVQLTANPRPGYRFVAWAESDLTVGTLQDLEFIATEDRALTALFEFASSAPSQPVNSQPSGTGVSLTPLLVASDFSDSDGDSHASSAWQILDGEVGNVVWSLETTSGDLTEVSVPGGMLEPGTVYWWQVQYSDSSGGASDWSEATSFTTNERPETPTNVSPSDGATDFSSTPTLTASVFSDSDSDSHVASQWRVSGSSGFSSIAWSHESSTPDLEGVDVPDEILENSTIYFWQVRYLDAAGLWSDWSDGTSFTVSDASDLIVRIRDGDGAVPTASEQRLKLVRWRGVPGQGGQNEPVRSADPNGVVTIPSSDSSDGQLYTYNVYYEEPNAFDPVNGVLGEFWASEQRTYATGDSSEIIEREYPFIVGGPRYYLNGNLLEAGESVPVGSMVEWRVDVRNATGGTVSDVAVEAASTQDDSSLASGGSVLTDVAGGDQILSGTFEVSAAGQWYLALRLSAPSLGKMDATPWLSSVVGSEGVTTISSFPYEEGFESGLGEWVSSAGNDFDWIQNTGSTSSSNTGPSGAAVGAAYVYTEASGGNNPNKTAGMEATFDFSGLAAPELSFSYHMYGANMGSLSVDVFADGAWTTDVWAISGQQQTAENDPWIEQAVNLSAFASKSPVKIRFRGVTGAGFTSDMAIDDIGVRESSLPAASYQDWMAQYPEVPVNRRGPDDSAANDGIANIVKYFQGIDAMNSPGLAGLSQIERLSPTQMRAWFLRSKLVDGSATGSIRWSRDLISWHESGAAAGGTTVTLATDQTQPDHTDPNREWVMVDAVMTGQPATSLFLRLEVDYNGGGGAQTLFNEDFSSGDITSWIRYQSSPNGNHSVDASDGELVLSRTGAGGSGGTLRLSQETSIPVTPQTLLKFDVYPVSSSVIDGTGISNGEYPATVVVVLETPTGTKELRCSYSQITAAKPDREFPTMYQISTTGVVGWLRNEEVRIHTYFPDATEISEVRLEGAGWDFEGRFDNVRIQEGTLFAEGFESLVNGQAVTTSNTGLTYVRVGSQGGSITAASPSPFGSGIAGGIAGPSGASLNGVGVMDSLDLAAADTIEFAMGIDLHDLNGQVVLGLGAGNSFTGNSGFNTSEGLVWLRIDGGVIDRRTASGWTPVGASLTPGVPAVVSMRVDRTGGTMDLRIAGSLIGSDIPVTSASVVPNGLRIYAVNGASVTLDDIIVHTP
jgi:hypothetical protein